MLDLNVPRLIRLSPNWAAPIPLSGEPAFLTLTEFRYVRNTKQWYDSQLFVHGAMGRELSQDSLWYRCGCDLLWRFVISAGDDPRCDFSAKAFCE